MSVKEKSVTSRKCKTAVRDLGRLYRVKVNAQLECQSEPPAGGSRKHVLQGTDFHITLWLPSSEHLHLSPGDTDWVEQCHFLFLFHFLSAVKPRSFTAFPPESLMFQLQFLKRSTTVLEDKPSSPFFIYIN